jgi:hypothetical protein
MFSRGIEMHALYSSSGNDIRLFGAWSSSMSVISYANGSRHNTMRAPYRCRTSATMKGEIDDGLRCLRLSSISPYMFQLAEAE